MSTDASEDFFEYCPGLLFVADGAGAITRQSKALRDRFGARLANEATLASLAADDDSEIIAGFLRTLTEGDAPASCTFRVPDEDGAHTRLRCEARRSPKGSIHGVLELAPAVDEDLQIRLERKLLRVVMDTLDIVLWAVDSEGTFVYHDGKALATAGLTAGQFLGLNIFELYPPELNDMIREALNGTASHNKTEAHDVHWESWDIPLDNSAGETTHCVGLTLDITAATRTELELKHQLETIHDQQRAIHELSAPLIEVWDKVLTVPLVGVIDNERASELIERLLTKVSVTGARFAIVDLTGVESLDTATASHILRLLGSLGLLGVEGLLTGISPIVAQTMVGLGIDLQDVTTRRTLRDGLRYCMAKLD